MSRALFLMFLLLAVTAFAAGCGGSSAEETDGGGSAAQGDDTGATETTDDQGADGGDTGQVVQLGVKEGQLKFDKESYTAPAGTVTLRLTNPDAIPHNVAVKEGDNVLEEGELVSNGEVSEVTVELEAGNEYTIYCTPHESAGMVAGLTVS